MSDDDRGGSALKSSDGKEVVYFDGPLTVGRHPVNGLVLEHHQVSGRHAVLDWDGQRWRLRDLGSRNGTSVNRRRLKSRKPIKAGDRVCFAGISSWTIERLQTPRADVICGTTETVAHRARRVDLDLHLAFTSAEEGMIRVVHADGEWTVTTAQRFILLYLLGSARGDWVDDGELKTGLWGRRGLDRMDPSALHKLIHDTRQMFLAEGIDGWIVEKEGGRTRLSLPPGRVHIENRG